MINIEIVSGIVIMCVIEHGTRKNSLIKFFDTFLWFHRFDPFANVISDEQLPVVRHQGWYARNLSRRNSLSRYVMEPNHMDERRVFPNLLDHLRTIWTLVAVDQSGHPSIV